MMYDAEAEEFVPLITEGGLQVDPVLHPFIIIRARHVPEHKCPWLLGSIKHLMNTRRAAQEKFDADVGLEGGDARFGPMGVGVDTGPVDEEANTPTFLNLSDIDTRSDVRVMILFDEDENDPDYVCESSVESSSDEEMSISDEEDEAIETDLEDEIEVVIDLTHLSSDSICSQEI